MRSFVFYTQNDIVAFLTGGNPNLDALRRVERGIREKIAQGLFQEGNDALQKDVEREQQLEQAQRDFFSAVSHELKTPITVMKGQLGGMLDGIGVYADRDKYLARSMAVANQMESLVQELLTVSRMERGGELSMIPVELTALIRNCLQNYDELFRQKEQEVVADLPPEIWSVGDPALLKKALGNLLSHPAQLTFHNGDGGFQLMGNRREEIPLGLLQLLFPLYVLLTSLFYAHFITRPIVRLSGISQKLSELDFSWRCKEHRTDEIGTLAHNGKDQQLTVFRGILKRKLGSNTMYDIVRVFIVGLNVLA